MSGKPVDRGLSLPTVAGLADLAVGPESREGFKKRQEVDPAWPTVRARNAANEWVLRPGRRIFIHTRLPPAASNRMAAPRPDSQEAKTRRPVTAISSASPVPVTSWP